jgi:hypothetical protein
MMMCKDELTYNNLDDDSDEEGWLTILFTLI